MKLQTMLLPTGEFILVVSEAPDSTAPPGFKEFREHIGAVGLFVTKEPVEIIDALVDEEAVRADDVEDEHVLDESQSFDQDKIDRLFASFKPPEFPPVRLGFWQADNKIEGVNLKAFQQGLDEQIAELAAVTHTPRWLIDADTRIADQLADGVEFSPAGLPINAPSRKVEDEELTGTTDWEPRPGDKVKVVGSTVFWKERFLNKIGTVIENEVGNTPVGSVLVEFDPSNIESWDADVAKIFVPTTSLISVEEKYNHGGQLPPGVSVVINATTRPELVLTAELTKPTEGDRVRITGPAYFPHEDVVGTFGTVKSSRQVDPDDTVFVQFNPPGNRGTRWSWYFPISSVEVIDG